MNKDSFQQKEIFSRERNFLEKGTIFQKNDFLWKNVFIGKSTNVWKKAILSFLKVLHCDFLKYCTQEQLFCQTDSVRFTHRSMRVSHQFSDFKISKSLVVHRGSKKKIEIQPNFSIANGVTIIIKEEIYWLIFKNCSYAQFGCSTIWLKGTHSHSMSII